MAKDVIHTHGQDVAVREDEAKEFRGVNWALWSIGAFILIVAAVFGIFMLGASRDGEVQSPAQISNTTTTR
jgi:heme/copper-type cytochrome/quinol oxidase subunit 2